MFAHIDFRIVKNELVFIAYSPHCFATMMSENDKKKNNEAYDPSKLSKTTPNQTNQYLLIPTTNSPPTKREKRPFRTPPTIFQNASQSSRGPLRPRRPPGEPPRPLQDPQGTPPRPSPDLSRHFQHPRGTPRDPAQSLQNSTKAFTGYLRHRASSLQASKPPVGSAGFAKRKQF